MARCPTLGQRHASKFWGQTVLSPIHWWLGHMYLNQILITTYLITVFYKYNQTLQGSYWGRGIHNRSVVSFLVKKDARRFRERCRSDNKAIFKRVISRLRYSDYGKRQLYRSQYPHHPKRNIHYIPNIFKYIHYIPK